MSNDLIRRNVLDDILELYEKHHPRLATNVYEFGVALRQLIKNTPTVAKIDTNDIEYKAYCKGLEDGKKITRPQGEWIGNAFDEHHCNKCGHYALWEEESDGYYEAQSRFCPYCGAKMFEGEEE